MFIPLCMVIYTCLSVAVEADGDGTTQCQKKIDLLSKHGTFVKDNLNRLCPENPCDEYSRPINATQPCPPYCSFLNGACRPKILLLSHFQSPQRSVLQTYANAAQLQYLVASRNLSLNPHARSAVTNRPSTNSVQGRSFMLKDGRSSVASPLGEKNDEESPTGRSSAATFSNNHFGCLSNFPIHCNINFFNMESLYPLLEPPVNIPYCLRIPCLSSNPSLETDRAACQSHPGCYFDDELSFRRQGLGYPVLPGVPICHLAIRNSNFLRLADEFVRRRGEPWNPLYTQCLINQNGITAESSDPGCYSLKTLTYFGVPLKMAGWKGITAEDCYLINSCYIRASDREHKCFHPAAVDEIAIRAGEDPFRQDDFESHYEYGQALCHPFNSNSPEDFLRSYHECRQSGCVVDHSINSRTIHKQFLNLVLSPIVPKELRPQFWDMIRRGEVTPGNWKTELRQLQTASQRNHPSYSFYNSENILNQRLFENLEAVKRMIDNSTNSTPTNPTAGIDGNIVNGPFLGGASLNPIAMPGYLDFNNFYSSANGFGENANTEFSPLFRRLSMLSTLRSTSSANEYGNFINLLYPIPQRPSICPYQDFTIPSYPPLKGSFNGCCDKNLCYVPKTQTIKQRSGPSAYLSEYTEWSKCSSSCGGGTRNRRRICQKLKFDDSPCFGDTDESQECNTYDCPYWKPWGTYGPCSRTCGKGTQTRTRVCVVSKPASSSTTRKECSGSETVSKVCNIGPCPEYGPWGGFSTCACGRGRQIRSRNCVSNCDSAPKEDFEEQECEKFCGSPVAVKETRCNIMSCSKLVNFECQILESHREGNDTPHCADFIPQTKETCYEGRCKACRRFSQLTPFQCLSLIRRMYAQFLQHG